jgi:hypothetical protein
VQQKQPILRAIYNNNSEADFSAYSDEERRLNQRVLERQFGAAHNNLVQPC